MSGAGGPTNSVEPYARRDIAAGVLGRCRNCQAELLGRYCVECGQASGAHVPSTRELIHELLEGLTHSDSRLWRSLLWLWFKPGKLTAEFIAGRRMSYLPPFRLYLVLSVIFFLLASTANPDKSAVRIGDPKQQRGNYSFNCADLNMVSNLKPVDWNARIQHACQEVLRDNGTGLLHAALSTMPKAMFIFLPLIAFLHMLMYWRPRHRYAEHLLFFVHLHAFFFSVAIVLALLIGLAAAWPAFYGTADVLQAILWWLLPVYTFIAMRRVFLRGWLSTFMKAFALSFVYVIAMSLTLAGVFVYAVLQL